MRTWVRTLVLACVASGSWAFGGSGAVWAGQDALPEGTLYERLGRANGIAVLVDDLVDRMEGNEVLLANPYLAEALARVPGAGLKFQVTAMLCAAAGGPETYHGSSMKDAHAHLRIGARDWQAFLAELQAAIEATGVAEPVAAELLRLVDGHRADIVSVSETPEGAVKAHQ
jgi:hemoglobin